MPRAKNQHWVPQFYLRYFAMSDTVETDEPKAWIFSKRNEDGDPVVTNIKNVATGRYLYSPKNDDGSRDWETEEKFQQLESLLATLWPSLANGFVDLGDDSTLRRILALFIATLYLRNRARLRDVKDVHRRLVDFYETIPKDKEGNPLVMEIEYRDKTMPFDTLAYREYKNADADDIRRMFVGQIRSNAIWLAESLLKKRWSVVFSETPVFITTDHPVTIAHTERERFGFKTEGTVVFFPLSPTRILLMDDLNDQPRGYYYPLGDHGPAPFNFVLWRDAGRFMISPRPTDQVCAEMIRCDDAHEIC
jgi:hypothetical protein